MLIWDTIVEKDVRIKIENKVAEIRKLEQQEDYEPDATGGFSDVFFLDQFAIKYTSFWDYDNLSDEESMIDLELQSDTDILQSISSSNHAPKLYAHSTDGFFTILERMENENLEDYLLQGGQWSKEIGKGCTDFLTDLINSGWFPFDLCFRCIFPFEDSNLKVIDFNLYQKIDYLIAHDYSVYDLSKTSKELAAELIFDFKKTGMSLIERDRKYLI